MTGKADAVRAVSQQFKDRTNTVIEGVMAHLRDDNAKEILGPSLSPLIGRGDLKSIVKFALYADVLRMVRDMVMADGEISDEEVQESLGLLSVLAAAFAKVRKEYASFTQLSNENARQFLSQYEADAGLFGYANEATRWAGVNACRNIEAACGSSGPLNSFGGALVSWADSVASADGMSTSEQQHLATIRSLCTSARDASHSPAGATDTGPSSPEDLLTAASLESDPHRSMSRFTHIEDDAAALLAGASYPLTLNCLVALSPYAAACLGRHAGGTLELNGLREISDGVAEGLSTRTKTLSLNGLVTLSDASAMHLSRCTAKLSLRGLTELADTPGHLALAAKLASQEGNLVLDGLERLGPKVAAKLSEHIGRLALRGLPEIDDEVLAALFSRSVQPELSADMLRTLFVRGSERFVSQYCIANDGDLGILQSLSSSECDLSAAKAMVDAGIDLSFDEVHEISPDIGSVLATSTHDIRIGHLATLSEESARALREHSGTLIIGTVSEVSLGAAKALAEHRGPIKVEDIDDLPEHVAAVLDQRSGDGESEQPLVERACELLSTVQDLATYDPADLRDVDFKLLATMAGEVIQKLRDAEHVHRPAAESTCGVLERLQELADQDLADFDDVDLQQLANDAEAATRELNQGGSNESEDGVPEDRVLTKEIAEQFCSSDSDFDLRWYKVITDEAAEVLGKYDGSGYSGPNIYLPHITHLSEAAAKSLFCFEGNLELSNLESLSLTPSSLDDGTQWRADLTLGLTDVSDDTAAALASTKGSLSLDQLQTVPDSTAEILARHAGRLSLEGIESLSDEAAKLLNRHKDLSCSNFFDLSSENTIALTFRGRGQHVFLESASAVEQLAEHADALKDTWTVDISGLGEEECLSEPAFTALAQLPCRIKACGCAIDDALASNLATFKASALDLRECALVSEDAARRLLGFGGAIQVKMNTHDEAIRQVLKAHASLAEWGQWKGPYVDLVCKNCGDHRQLEFPDNEANIYSVFGDGPGPWAICPECREELSEEELTALED